jgi:biopolymer transport protein TolR
MNVGTGNRRFMSDINVTPFVDVMLVLLIIFMVTAPMMIQGLDVSLPTATAEPLPSKEEPLIISIDKSSQIFISDFQVTAEFLREKLSAILKGRKDRTVYLKADKDVSYGTVVEVMSEIKGAGVEKLGMVTEPEVYEKKKK